LLLTRMLVETLLEVALAVGAVGLAAGILTLAAVERRSVPWSR